MIAETLKPCMRLSPEDYSILRNRQKQAGLNFTSDFVRLIVNEFNSCDIEIIRKLNVPLIQLNNSNKEKRFSFKINKKIWETYENKCKSLGIDNPEYFLRLLIISIESIEVFNE